MPDECDAIGFRAELPPASAGRPTPEQCGGGSWLESEVDDIVLVSADGQDHALCPEVPLTLSALSKATTPQGFRGRCADVTDDDATWQQDVDTIAHEVRAQRRPSLNSREIRCVDQCEVDVVLCEVGESRALDKPAVRQKVEVQKQCTPVVPSDDSAAAQDGSSEASSSQGWAQRAIVVSISVVSAGAFASAAGGVLPVAIAAGSLGFTLGLLSSILGIRVGRWVY